MSTIRDSIGEKVKRAIWQYLIDHSQLQKNGYWGIQLYFDENDFWDRVDARYNGKYRRYEIADKERRQKNLFDVQKINNLKTDIVNKRIQSIQKGSNLVDKVLLRIYWAIKRYLRLKA